MSRSYPEIVSTLLAIPKFGAGVGLHRMLWLTQDLRATHWLTNLDAIKVTGSNGKGSVCAMVSSILQALEIQAGQYISPHLLRFNERMSINGNYIADHELAEALDWFLARQAEYAQHYPADTIGAFESFTAMALYHFTQHQPQALIVEAGIGGRYDSTRIVPGKLVGLPSLDLEHTELLGHTLELIAYDKTDLCPEHGTLVIGHIDSEVLRRLKAYCELRHITPVSTDETCSLHRTEFTANEMVIDVEIDGVRYNDLRISLQGQHQIVNAMVAVLLARKWIEQHDPQLAGAKFNAAVYQGLDQARNMGRFQKIGSDPAVFVDVGHSPGAIECLLETVHRVIGDQPILLVTGVSYNKEVEQIVARLVQVASAVICTRAYHRGSPVADILAVVKRHRSDLPIFEAGTIEQAVALAREMAIERKMTVLVAGGLFLAIEAMQAWAGEDPQALQFF